MSHKVLITGCGGYIGSVSADLFLKNGWEVVGLDNFSTGFRAPLEFLQQKYGQKKFRYYEIDLKNGPGDLFEKEKGIAAIVHYAAHCLVNESMENPVKYFRNNVFGSLNLFEAALEAGVAKIVFSSTCAVYGQAQKIPIREDHPRAPSNPYGESKKMTEDTLRWLAERRGLNYVILRYFNVCGASADGKVGDSKHPSVLLVQNAVRGALKIEPFYLTCPKVDTPDGTPIRDYIDVVDLNTAHLKALEYLFSGGQSDVFNLGTGKGSSVLEIVNAVQKITGVEFKPEPTTPRQGEDPRLVADNTKAKKILDWEPKRALEDSVNSLVKWYRAHPKGWEK